jgi:hypothetical protein
LRLNERNNEKKEDVMEEIKKIGNWVLLQKEKLSSLKAERKKIHKKIKLNFWDNISGIMCILSLLTIMPGSVIFPILQNLYGQKESLCLDLVLVAVVSLGFLCPAKIFGNKGDRDRKVPILSKEDEGREKELDEKIAELEIFLLT